jgi:hypothetical protein
MVGIHRAKEAELLGDIACVHLLVHDKELPRLRGIGPTAAVNSKRLDNGRDETTFGKTCSQALVSTATFGYGTNFDDDIPLSAICHAIVRDLRRESMLTLEVVYSRTVRDVLMQRFFGAGAMPARTQAAISFATLSTHSRQ